ncbi:hypothetical protein BGW41_003014 [Actinomortierella wolfii]|nr:hypothetical protein BGW41_003014 [Actinomortierella wolfii]
MSQHTPQASTTDPMVVTITFLLVSGKKTSLGFKSTDTIEDVKRRVFEEWPKGRRPERMKQGLTAGLGHITSVFGELPFQQQHLSDPLL